MRILITGSSGQLGSILVQTLAKTHTVTSVDLAPGKLTQYVGSIASRDFIFPLVQGMDAVLHSASLHARHLQTHTRSEFVDTNMQGTLNLLEAALEMGVRRFVYTSTTSLYGNAMAAPDRAVWVTEALVPQPRDIYDVTKIAAENLCQALSAQSGLVCASLRVSRFFPEPENLTAIYRLYRGVDVRDVVQAHILALQADFSGYEVFNVSAHSPFTREETFGLYHDARAVILRHYPSAEKEFARLGWKLPERIDRVYVTEKAEKLLKYQPQFNFQNLLA